MATVKKPPSKPPARPRAPRKPRAPKTPPTHREKLLGYLGKGYPAEYEILIERYCETAEILDRMRDEIRAGDLMVEYTNKANATNTIKNPLIAEVPRYVATLERLLKALGLTGHGKRPSTGEPPEDGWDQF